MKSAAMNSIPSDYQHSYIYILFTFLRICSSLIAFQVVGFIWGFVCQQFDQTVYIIGAGFILASLVSAGSLVVK